MNKLSILIAYILLLTACGKGVKQEKNSLTEKKANLEKLKAEKTKLEAEITSLQEEIARLDTSVSNERTKLVTLSTIGESHFKHYIDLRGQIDADDISYIAPKMGPAQVKAVYVKQGQAVKKGQLLLKLEDAIIRQQIAAATQQLQGLRTQLNYSKTIYERQKNLWDQGIGTEVQLISARTNVESLDNQLKAAQEQVKVAQEQLKTTNVTSDVDGIADIVNIKVGEIFSGMTAMGPQIKIVNTHNPKVVVSIPENYMSRLSKGTPIEISVPDAGKSFSSVLSVISQSIDPVQRGFMAEARLSSDPVLRPNQTAIVKILDYQSEKALVIPVNVVQSDEKGKYVFIAEASTAGLIKARRQTITLGEVYADSVEVKSGLLKGAQLVTQGYQNLYEGQALTSQP